ncbi:MAG: hypothetical protein V4812_14805 [Pseudomonadota bacterium]
MKLKHWLPCLSLCSFISMAEAAVLFDVDFASPLNTSGQPITIDASNKTPTAIHFGSPVMQSNYAGLPGNWAIFNTPSCGPYEQIRFNLPANTKKAYLSYDIYSESLNNSDNNFSVHIDSTDYGARSLDFHGSLNQMYVFNFGSSFLGSFVDLQKYHIDIVADAAANSLTVSVDGVQKHARAFGSTDIKSIRMNLSPWTGAASICNRTNVAISNIKIYENPEDLTQTPVVNPIAANLILSPGASSTVGPLGGSIAYRRSVQNLSATERSVRYWIYASMPDGSAYPLYSPFTTGIPAAGQTTTTSTLAIPAWFPAGSHNARIVAVDLNTGQIVTGNLPFKKTAP